MIVDYIKYNNSSYYSKWGIKYEEKNRDTTGMIKLIKQVFLGVMKI